MWVEFVALLSIRGARQKLEIFWDVQTTDELAAQRDDVVYLQLKVSRLQVYILKGLFIRPRNGSLLLADSPP